MPTGSISGQPGMLQSNDEDNSSVPTDGNAVEDLLAHSGEGGGSQTEKPPHNATSLSAGLDSNGGLKNVIRFDDEDFGKNVQENEVSRRKSINFLT